MKIATLSTELTGPDMKLRGAERVSAILSFLQERKPDILLTAGWSLEKETDLKILEQQLKGLDWDGLLFVEVKNYGKGLKRKISNVKGAGCLFSWTQENGLSCMGRQHFMTSNDAEEGTETVIPDFEKALNDRVVTFRGMRIGALICGELNALKGRKYVDARTAEIRDWLRSLDMIVNPIHDRMANDGTGNAKKRWLSEGGRIYLSSSNWNSRKEGRGGIYRQSRAAKTLHDLFVDGVRKEMLRQGNDSVEYRNLEIDWGKRRS